MNRITFSMILRHAACRLGGWGMKWDYRKWERMSTLSEAVSDDQIEQARWIVSEFSVNVLTAVHWTLVRPWELLLRRVGDTGILIPLKGSVVVELEGRILTVAPGQYIMIKDNAEHAVRLPDGADDLEMIAIHCHITNLWRVPLAGYFCDPVGDLASPQTFHHLLRQFVGTFNANLNVGRSWGEVLVRQLLLEALADGARLSPPTQRIDQRIGRALMTIHDAYHTTLSVDSLAADNNLSVAQFRKLFKHYVGVRPKDYIVQTRLKAAKQLLQETDRPVKQIADEAGFINVQYFHSVFKRHVNRTPAEFRHQTPAL